MKPEGGSRLQEWRGSCSLRNEFIVGEIARLDIRKITEQLPSPFGERSAA